MPEGTAHEVFEYTKKVEKNHLSILNEDILDGKICDLTYVMTNLSNSATRLIQIADRASVDSRIDIPKPLKDDTYRSEAEDIIFDWAASFSDSLRKMCGCGGSPSQKDYFRK